MITGAASVQQAQSAPNLQTNKISAGKTASFSDELKKEQKKPGGLEGIFSEAAEKYNVPVNLLKAVAKAESDFQTDAVSSCGAQGIMQLMPSTASSLGVTNSFDPEQNIMGGAKYLGQLLSSFGDPKLAVAAYNAGGGAVRRYGGVPPYEETQNYVKKVLGYAGEDVAAFGWTSEEQMGFPENGTVFEGGSSLSGAPSGAAGNSVFSLGKVAFSTEDYQLFAKMYVQKLEQNALNAITGSALQNKTKKV